MRLENGDTFFLKDGVVRYVSHSGGEYEISPMSCTCKGYSFRRTCRHFVAVMESGILTSTPVKHKVTAGRVFRSPTIVAARNEAIRLFLKKRGAPHSLSIIRLIERVLTPKTPPKKVLLIAFNHKREPL